MLPRSMPAPRRRFALLFVAIILTFLAAATAHAEVLRNDGWDDGESAGFQGGFVVGEIGAARLVPTEPGPSVLGSVELLFGGAAGQRTVTLHIWDDSALTNNPGPEIFSGDFIVTGANDAINVIDLSGEGIEVDGPIRVGIEFQHSGLPSIARDDDGTIDVTRNFIYTSGVWFRSSLFGLTGDWIIRATTTGGGGGFTVGGTVSGFAGNLVLQNNGGDDLLVISNGPFTFPTPLPDGSPYDVTVLSGPGDCIVLNGTGTIDGANVTNVLVDCGAPLLQNDGWEDGDAAAFQGGFVAGEIGAVRLVPLEPCPCDLDRVELLFGGAPGVATVTLRIWDDTDEQLIPGPELFSGDYQLTGADDAINVIDLTQDGITVNGAFRVGIEFQHAGLPSIARDADGTINVDRNFIYTSGTWFRSSLFGLTGDWIIRAALAENPASVPEPSRSAGRIVLSPTPYSGGELSIGFARGESGAPSLDAPALGADEPIELSIFDGSGRLVRRLASGLESDGVGPTVWDGTDAQGAPVRSGVYFVQRLAGGYAWSEKLTVVR